MLEMDYEKLWMLGAIVEFLAKEASYDDADEVISWAIHELENFCRVNGEKKYEKWEHEKDILLHYVWEDLSEGKF